MIDAGIEVELMASSLDGKAGFSLSYLLHCDLYVFGAGKKDDAAARPLSVSELGAPAHRLSWHSRREASRLKRVVVCRKQGMVRISKYHNIGSGIILTGSQRSQVGKVEATRGYLAGTELLS